MNNIVQFAAGDYVVALSTLLQDSSKLTDSGLAMLRAHYYAPSRELSAEILAMKAGEKKYGTANLQYGKFAHKICDILKFRPEERESSGEPIWTLGICIPGEYKNEHGHFQWVLRPEVAEAMEQLLLIQKTSFPDALDDIESKQSEMEDLAAKDRDAWTKSRIGQGIFRKKLVDYWQGCSVTGCTQFEILNASHIKPWRDCDRFEALDLANGLLLTPNLDKAFDMGFITFTANGEILLSSQLNNKIALQLGINKDMKLVKDPSDYLQNYLTYHRMNAFRK